MDSRKDGRAMLVTALETVVFFILVYFGRLILDQFLANLGLLSLIVIAIRFAFLIAMISLALLVDRLVFAYLKKRGKLGP